MSIQVICPGCRKPLEIPESAIGKTVKCQACEFSFVAVAPPPAEEAVVALCADQTASSDNSSIRSIGILSWSRRRGTSQSFVKCLQNVTSNVDFLTTWGGSLYLLDTVIERKLREMVVEGKTFRILIVKPGSAGEKKRRKENPAWPDGQPESHLRTLLGIKHALGARDRDRFTIKLYSEPPVWSMAIWDNQWANIGFYGPGVGRDHPALILQRSVSPSFFDAFKMEYERIWQDATEVRGIGDLDYVLRVANDLAGKGFIFALTGPPGVGKSTVARLLQAKFAIAPRTVTSCSPRSGEQLTDQYDHVTDEHFEEMCENEQFLCHTEHRGFRYGIRRNILEAINSPGVLVLDTIFPPKVLKDCLGDRIVVVFLTTDTGVCRQRLGQVEALTETESLALESEIREQLKQADDADYVVPNDDPADVTAKILEELAQEIFRSFQQRQSIYPKEMAYLRPGRDSMGNCATAD